MARLAVFILITVGLTVLSWRALKDPSSHGFWRFFAFVAVTAQVLLALPFWLRRPFSWNQVASWLLLTVSLSLVIAGVCWLRKIGGHRSRKTSSANYEFENTAQLVTTGPYHWIRHPMYSSLLFLSWGAFSKHPALVGLGVALLATFFLWWTARVEEGENLRAFGNEYAAYMKKSKMFIPFLI